MTGLEPPNYTIPPRVDLWRRIWRAIRRLI